MSHRCPTCNKRHARADDAEYCCMPFVRLCTRCNERPITIVGPTGICWRCGNPEFSLHYGDPPKGAIAREIQGELFG